MITQATLEKMKSALLLSIRGLSFNLVLKKEVINMTGLKNEWVRLGIQLSYHNDTME
jgi:hypothetical protein